MTDKICYNGELVSPDNMGGDVWRSLSALREENYVYQHIRTCNYEPVMLERHLEIIRNAAQDMYGKKPDIAAGDIGSGMQKLLKANRYHNRNNLTELKVFPDGSFMIECREQLLYDNFVEWHTRPTVEIFPCEYLFMGYPTAVSKVTLKYAAGFAAAHGADAAVIANGQGVLTNINDEPLFVVSGGEVLVSPLGEGSADSAMRRLVIDACTAAGMQVSEKPVTADMFEKCDEAFYATPQGLVSIKGTGGKLFYNIIPGKIASIINDRLGL